MNTLPKGTSKAIKDRCYDLAFALNQHHDIIDDAQAGTSFGEPSVLIWTRNHEGLHDCSVQVSNDDYYTETPINGENDKADGALWSTTETPSLIAGQIAAYYREEGL